MTFSTRDTDGGDGTACRPPRGLRFQHLHRVWDILPDGTECHPDRRGSTSSPIATLLLTILLLFSILRSSSWGGETKTIPRRLLSICCQGDQLLLQLVDRDRIIALSDLATDPDISPHWQEARDVPVIAGRVEDLVRLHPDLVIAGNATTRAAVAILKRFGVPVLEISVPDTFDELRTQILKIATVIGAEDRAKPIVARMDERLSRLRAADILVGERPTALLYFQDGFTPGGHTFANAILEAAGFRNLGANFSAGFGASAPLEAVLMTHPRFLILSHYREAHPTATQVSATQPLFRNLGAGTKVLSVSFRHLACPDPGNLDLAEQLQQQLIQAVHPAPPLARVGKDGLCVSVVSPGAK